MPTYMLQNLYNARVSNREEVKTKSSTKTRGRRKKMRERKKRRRKKLRELRMRMDDWNEFEDSRLDYYHNLHDVGVLSIPFSDKFLHIKFHLQK